MIPLTKGRGGKEWDNNDSCGCDIVANSGNLIEVKEELKPSSLMSDLSIAHAQGQMTTIQLRFVLGRSKRLPKWGWHVR